MTIQTAYNITGPLGLFLGVETASWQLSDFLDAAKFAHQHSITSLFIKVSEVGSKAGAYWYGGLDGFANIKTAIEQAYPLKVIPYGFVYGDLYGHLQDELAVAKNYLIKFSRYCLDIEGSAWSNASAATWGKAFSDTLKPIPGVFFVSCPADPAENNQLAALQAIAPCTDVFMPMVYSNALANFNDYISIASTTCPTFDLSQEFGANDPQKLALLAYEKTNNVSLWEYQYAVQNPALVDQIASAFRKSTTVLNSSKEVANFINATQFVGGHDEYACGPFAVSHVKYATAPNAQNTHTQAELQQWAYNEYTAHIGPDTPSDTMGSSIDNMHQFFQDAGLHYWEMPIDVNSVQSQDIARIKTALKAGYPVVATVREDSVFDVGLQKNPYWWGPSGNHILVYSGIADSGNLLVQDTANVQGALQGANWVQPGPREYDAGRLANSYAAIVQTSWLASIPSGDPLTWAADFNAQTGGIVANTVNYQDDFIVFLWELAAPYFHAAGSTLPARDTGIFNSWKENFLNGKYKGIVLTSEIKRKDTNGNDVIVQAFTSGLCIWANGSATWI